LLRSRDVCGVNLEGYGLPNEFHQENESEAGLLPQQDAFAARERAAHDTHPLAFRQEGVRIAAKLILESGADCFDLLVGYRDRPLAVADHVYEARSAKNLQAILRAHPDEEITRKERQRHGLPAVRPPPGNFDERQKRLHPPSEQLLLDCPLMTTPGVDGVPMLAPLLAGTRRLHVPSWKGGIHVSGRHPEPVPVLIHVISC